MAEDTLRLIRDFCSAQKVKNFLVVLLPESLQVSEQYDNFFKRCGYDSIISLCRNAAA